MAVAMHGAASPAAMKGLLSPVPGGKLGSPDALKAQSPASFYERLESNIGEGTYGKVHKYRSLKHGRTVAIKKAKISAMDRDVGGISFTVLREIKLMQAVRHPNVMGCLDVFADGGAIHLVMEFMDGDLKKVIEDHSLDILDAHAKCLARQLLDGLRALHERWFVHRDVAPGNVLLNFSTGVAKLTDFGFARTHGLSDRPLTPMCTTLWYRAPELLYGAKYYGEAVDIWSAGCIFAELFLRHALFQGRGQIDMLSRITENRGPANEEVWRDVTALPNFVEFTHHRKAPMEEVLPTASPASRTLVDLLLSLDPKSRPSAKDALEHECFTSAQPLPCAPQDLPFVRPGSSS